MLWLYIAAPIAAVAIILAVTYLALAAHKQCGDPPERIENAAGFIKAHGTSLYDGEGKLFRLRGVNLGNWLLQEHWMAVSACKGFDTGLYTQKRGMAALRSNPKITPEQADGLEALYADTYIQEHDFERIAALGLNAVRVVFSYLTLTTDGEHYRDEPFKYLDFAVEMCKKYGLYAVLDLHGAIGSQNQDIHSGDDSQFDLYKNARNTELTCKLWRDIASRYKNEKTVAAYDLLNEPRRKAHRFGGKINFEFYDKLYKAVREVDSEHLIMIECFSFPINGGKIKKYGWNNVCMEYHIYNLTPFSQLACLRFYNALHNLSGNKAPVYIGEWNAFVKKKEWYDSIEYFDKLGWSYSSWTYKTNAHYYKSHKWRKNWGVFELDMPAAELYTADYAEIEKTYASVGTENARPSVVYDIYSELFGSETNKSSD